MDPGNPPKYSRLIWGILVIVILIVIGGFVSSRLNSSVKGLGVFGTVPSFSLTNQNFKVVTPETLQGNVWIVDVIFTRCPVQCLKLTALMRDLQANLPKTMFVSLTADPDYDTPPVLKAYADKFVPGLDRWHFLTGKKQDVFQVAVNGFKFAVVPKEQQAREFPDDLFIHSTMFALVDKKGQIRGWFEANDPEALKKLIDAARFLQRRS